MKKLIFYTLIAILGLNSCSSSSDTPVDPPVPPRIDITEDDLIGTWEIYYCSKAITKNPDTSPTNYPVYRDTWYDGMKTVHYKEGGVYKYRALNILDIEADKGTYKLSTDKKTIIYDGVAKDVNGNDSVFQNIATINTDFNPSTGILKLSQTFDNISDESLYRITQAQAYRNVAIAAGQHPNVEKVDVDFKTLASGKWEFNKYEYYENSDFNSTHSKRVTDSLSGYSLKFFYDNQSVQRCLERSYDSKTETWIEYTYRVIIVDDVLYMPYLTEVDGEPETYTFWVAKLSIEKDAATNKDINTMRIDMQFRSQENLSRMIRTLMYFNQTDG